MTSAPAVLALVLLVAAGAAGCGRENLARGRPVRASSVRLGDPAAVVNGAVEWGSFALHTADDSPAWLLVDLGRSAPIGDVEIFNRGDGYYDAWSTRVAVEVSADGQTFRRIGRCMEIFTQVSPCSVEAHGVRARWVRLVHPRALVLSEVEVHGPR